MQVVLLIVAVSMDVFFACVSCGMEKIKIGTKAAFSISGICSGVLFAALLVGSALDGIMAGSTGAFLSFLALFLLSLIHI